VAAMVNEGPLPAGRAAAVVRRLARAGGREAEQPAVEPSADPSADASTVVAATARGAHRA